MDVQNQRDWEKWGRDVFGPHWQQAIQLLEQEGYSDSKDVEKYMPTQALYLEFARRIGMPDHMARQSASHFGPNLPSAALQMDRQDRLALELVGWYGGDAWGFDNSASFVGDARIPFEFLVHDTTIENATRILEEQLIKAVGANDSHYDNKLANGTAPKVVFFTAAQYGTDPTVYPRDCAEAKDKRRFSMRPSHLGLHTDAFHMYFVSISEPRQKSDSGKNQPLQLHIVFVRVGHPGMAYCDEHFLLVNKRTFQPFFWKPLEACWRGFDFTAGQAFQGRGVKVNIAVAEDVVMWYGDLVMDVVSHSVNLQEVWETKYGVTVPPTQKKSGCIFWARGNCGKGASCNHFHDHGFERAFQPRRGP
ncbi:unnamed protein product [Polarella glacialis]|uniref:C3H1-type domain-containing protein n=1 Tax=Polarella glacialis TaxID=89957 RepID=A0A813L8R5_POLGL|nr:unnamed protein product [Polarella glacialis]